jgi:hypothetical protein
MATSKNPIKNPDVSETQTSDPEADNTHQDPDDLLYRSDRTELTPVEAFKWSVEGDQSPCNFNSIQYVWSLCLYITVPEVAACVSNKDDPTLACNSMLSPIHEVT